MSEVEKTWSKESNKIPSKGHSEADILKKRKLWRKVMKTADYCAKKFMGENLSEKMDCFVGFCNKKLKTAMRLKQSLDIEQCALIKRDLETHENMLMNKQDIHGDFKTNGIKQANRLEIRIQII